MTASGRDPQSVYTPVVQGMKNDNSNVGWNGLAFANVIQFRQEAQLQGVTSPDIIWECTTACYDQKYIETGGSAVDNTYISMAFLPFDETKYNQGLADYVKYTGKDKIAGLGVYAWAAGIEFQQALQSVVKAKGNNGITRANLLDSLKNLTSFNANGFDRDRQRRRQGHHELLRAGAGEERQVRAGVSEEEGHLRLHEVEPRDGEGRPDQVVDSRVRP